MQQDKNDIEEKLRQLDNQQLPDLSRMDEHWESMKLVLQPTLSSNVGKNKWSWLIGLLLLTGTIALFVIRKNALPGNESHAQKMSPQITATVDTTLSDSPVQLIIPDNPSEKNTTKDLSLKNTQVKNDVEDKVFNLPVQLNTDDSTLRAINPDAQKKLNELLGSLAKKAQEFIIDNRKDTTLFAAEGSSLFIPANSLGGSSSVKILLKEFYKTSDIVLNKLSTTSNGEQLITGGMVHISASVNGKPVNVLPGKAIKWYLPDTSNQMEQMQLFKGEEKEAGDINWINTGQGFSWPRNSIVVRVLDLRNEPFKTIERKKGLIGYFLIADKPQLSREKLKELYREKYGYYKVRFRKGHKRRVNTKLVNGIIYSDEPVGDSAWLSKEWADKYKLPSTQSGIGQGYSGLWGNGIVNVLNTGSRRTNKTSNVDTISFNAAFEFKDVSIELEKKYGVNISSLGWINCDRFYNDRREKINYFVDLQDSAVNYFTMMVFNEMRSMMTGYIMGNQVQFSSVPVGESVKIISIGVDKKGETVMAMQETTISKKGLAGLPFEVASANNIKSSVTQIDKQP
jgi:hypothetical protein